MLKIPTFLHIPRCGGTCMLGHLISSFFYYGEVNQWVDKETAGKDPRMIRIYLVNEKNQIQAMLLVYDRANLKKLEIFKQPDPRRPRVFHVESKHINFILESLKKHKMALFAILVASSGIPEVKASMYDQICEAAGGMPKYFTVLRNPFDRALSLYNYLTSNISSHEPTNLKKMKFCSFKEYLFSDMYEEAWLIRKLCNVSDSQAVTEEHCSEACDILKNFKIKDISELEKLAEEIMLECYDIELYKCKHYIKHPYINKSKVDLNISLENFSEAEKVLYSVRSSLEHKLYTHHIT